MEEVDMGLRYTLHRNLLKSVLIRVDYTGVTGVERWVDENSEFMKTAFAEYNRGVNNNARLDLSNMEEVAKTLSIPVSEIKKETQHIYTDCKLEKEPDVKTEDNVKMTITSYYMTFYVICKNYKNIDIYIKFLTDFFARFASVSQYIKVRRVGIRKIGGKPFENLDKAYQVFRPELFFGKHIIDGYHQLQREYKDGYILPDESLKVNYTRLFKEQNTDEGKRYAYILDTDCYVDEYIIKRQSYELPNKIGDILVVINKHLFELFVNSVQPDYIKNHGDEQ